MLFIHFIHLTLKVPETKVAEFANSLDLDEVAHNEPPHLDLVLENLQMKILSSAFL